MSRVTSFYLFFTILKGAITPESGETINQTALFYANAKRRDIYQQKKLIIINKKYKKATTSKTKFWPITYFTKENEFGELNYFILCQLVNKQRKVAKGPVRSSSQATTNSMSLKVKDVRFCSDKCLGMSLHIR